MDEDQNLNERPHQRAWIRPVIICSIIFLCAVFATLAFAIWQIQKNQADPYRSVHLGNMGKLFVTMLDAEKQGKVIKAFALRNQAYESTARRDLASAERDLKLALKLFKEALGEDDEYVTPTYIDLAECLYAEHKYVQAEQAFVEALALREKTYGPDHSRVASLLHRLAHVETDMGKFDEAERAFRRELAVYEKYVGTESAEAGNVLVCLGANLTDAGKYVQARRTLQRAFALQEKSPLSASRELCRTLDRMAILFTATKEWDKAVNCATRSWKLHKMQKRLADLPLALQRIGAVYCEKGQWQEADSYYQKAIDLYLASKNPPHDDFASALYWKALCLEKSKQFSQAEKLAERSVELRKKGFGTEDIGYGKSMALLAAVRLEKGHADSAPIFRAALANLSAQSRYPGRETMRHMAMYVNLLEKEKKNSEATLVASKVNRLGKQHFAE